MNGKMSNKVVRWGFDRHSNLSLAVKASLPGDSTELPSIEQVRSLFYRELLFRFFFSWFLDEVSRDRATITFM